MLRAEALSPLTLSWVGRCVKPPIPRVRGAGGLTLRRVTTLYRCKAPTDLVCRCGKVARRMRAMELDFDEVRVPFLKRDRPEVEELTGQRWVPVLVHGDDVIHDSHRILEYLEWLDRRDD